jgi:hypothetical protein
MLAAKKVILAANILLIERQLRASLPVCTGIQQVPVRLANVFPPVQ